MGVYIKSMKMPKDDVNAFKQITITNNWIDGEVIMLAHDSITNEFIGEVVEVPEPHGKLVDYETIDVDYWEDADGYHISIEAETIIEAEEE